MFFFLTFPKSKIEHLGYWKWMKMKTNVVRNIDCQSSIITKKSFYLFIIMWTIYFYKSLNMTLTGEYLSFRSDRCLAQTRPSPPLFPGPQTTRTGLSGSGKTFPIEWAQESPASSISWSTLKPYSVKSSWKKKSKPIFLPTCFYIMNELINI